MRLFLLGLLLAACSQQSPPESTALAITLPTVSQAPQYLPVLILYKDGEYVNVLTAPSAKSSLKECLDDANAHIAKALENESIPDGGYALGACLPIPSFASLPPLAKKPREPKPTPEQGVL